MSMTRIRMFQQERLISNHSDETVLIFTADIQERQNEH